MKIFKKKLFFKDKFLPFKVSLHTHQSYKHIYRINIAIQKQKVLLIYVLFIFLEDVFIEEVEVCTSKLFNFPKYILVKRSEIVEIGYPSGSFFGFVYK